MYLVCSGTHSTVACVGVLVIQEVDTSHEYVVQTRQLSSERPTIDVRFRFELEKRVEFEIQFWSLI